MAETSTFIGREREVAALTRILTTSKPALVVLYGRRRVGKSTLLRHVVRNFDAIYYQATRVADGDNQDLFKRVTASVLGTDPILAGVTSWEGLLNYLAQHAGRRGRPLIVILDEFPYLCEGNAGLPSIVQKVWDGIRERRIPLVLVLCGSRISFMETLLAERNPLHGRQSAEFVIQPLTYREAARFVPRWSVEDRLRLFGVFGAMPYYLSLLDPATSLAANVQRLLLNEGAPLREEPTHLLQAELNQIARYASILRAIADGLHSTQGHRRPRSAVRGERQCVNRLPGNLARTAPGNRPSIARHSRSRASPQYTLLPRRSLPGVLLSIRVAESLSAPGRPRTRRLSRCHCSAPG